MHAIPMFLYVDTDSPQEAAMHKQAIEKLLGNPMVKIMLDTNKIPSRGFIVQDPQYVPPR